MAKAFIRGLQGDDPHHLKVAATPKHFAVNNVETDRTTTIAQISTQSLREYFLPVFKKSIVDAGAASLMTAYNGVNGVPSSVNKELLTDLLRNEWGFDGVVVTDVEAPRFLKDRHHFVRSYTEGAAFLINSGVDLLSDTGEWSGYLVTAVRKGMLTEERLNRSLSRILTLRFRLGMFDPVEIAPHATISAGANGSPGHLDLALEAALESIVLLKNDPPAHSVDKAKLLPLDSTRLRSIAVLGPYANVAQLGGYSGPPMKKPVTPLQGIRRKLGNMVKILHEGDMASVAACDAVIIVVGLNSGIEGEGKDRADLGLPPGQEDYVRRIARMNPRTVVVLQNGSPVAVDQLRRYVPVIVETWYSGEQGGNALADVLFGDYNPAGRLPITFYGSESRIPPMNDYEVSMGRTYMYFSGNPPYPFGHGLSYTGFEYSDLAVNTEGSSGSEKVMVNVDVKNGEDSGGDEVVQLYVRTGQTKPRGPLKRLAGFRRIHLDKGEKRRVAFAVASEDVSFWDEKQNKYVREPGKLEVLVGASSEDIRLRGDFALAH